MFFYATAVLVAGLLVALVLVYNGLVRRRNRLREAWSGVEVQLKRRHDLIPSLVATVQGYRQHEAATLERVVSQRREAQQAHDARSCSVAESRLGAGLVQLVAVAEGYPELKADEHFRRLMKDLVETEDAIQYARRYYNGSVRELNNGIETFPSNLVAGLFGFRPGDFFEIVDNAERQPVAIQR